MNIQEILAANTAEDGTIDHAAVQAEIDAQTVAKEEYEAKVEEARGAYAAAKAKYGNKGNATPPEEQNGQATPPSGTNEALEAISKLTEQVESLQGQITATTTANAVATWKAEAVAQGVPEETANNLAELAGNDISKLQATKIDSFIIPNSQSFGAKRAPDAAEQATKREAAMADFKKYIK